MLKKVFSVLMILCLSLTCFTGCGKSDIEYLNLLEEISNLEEFEIISDSEIVLSEELKIILKDNLLNESDVMLSDFGKLNLSIKGLVDSKNHYINLFLKLKDDKDVFNNETELFITEGGIFISKESLLNLYSLYLNASTVFSDLMISDIIENVSNNFSTVDYICLDTTNVFVLLDASNELYDNLEYENKAVIDFVKTLMNMDYDKSLDISMVKQNNKSYTFEVKAENIKDILITYISFLNDKLPIIEKYLLSEDYLISVFGDYSSNEEMIENVKEYKNTTIHLMESLQDFYDYVIDYFNDKDNNKEYNEYIESIKGSKYINILSKKDNVYNSEEILLWVLGGIKQIEVNTKSSIIVKDIEPKIISGGFIEDFITTAEKVSYMVNPAEIIECQWIANSNREIDDIYLEVARKEGTEDLVTNYVLRDGRLYLPLRKICETFGEEVSWDNINSKAYIVRGNEKIHMTGIVVNGSTFVRIRDFEKLNYDIKYEEGSMVNIVVITKK